MHATDRSRDFLRNARLSLIKGFVFLNVVLIFIWNLPQGCAIRKPVIPPSSLYMSFTGLNRQDWNQFAYSPMGNYHFESEITFRDGTKKLWAFPHRDRTGPFQGFLKTRYIEWEGRFFLIPAAWPDTARYIARLHANPVNPPVKVTLLMWEKTIPPPPGTGNPANQTPSVRRWDQFGYEIAPGDLP
jgi:hypothetical protein